MSTRAIQFLKQKKISFGVIKYHHSEKGAEFASEAVGFPLEQTIKTLVTDLGNNKYCLALMPGSDQLSLKHLAKACSVKKAVMADTATAERLTGYLVGGISPFGTKQNLPVIMEATLFQFDNVMINGGQRGTLLKLKPDDIKKALNCDIGRISA